MDEDGTEKTRARSAVGWAVRPGNLGGCGRRMQWRRSNGIAAEEHSESRGGGGPGLVAPVIPCHHAGLPQPFRSCARLCLLACLLISCCARQTAWSYRMSCLGRSSFDIGGSTKTWSRSLGSEARMGLGATLSLCGLVEGSVTQVVAQTDLPYLPYLPYLP